MKGVSEALWVVITAVVVLVVALIVLTMFGSSVTNVSTLTDAKNVCTSTFRSMCFKGSSEPSMWSQPIIVVNNVKQSCKQICGNYEWSGGACTGTDNGKFVC